MSERSTRQLLARLAGLAYLVGIVLMIFGYATLTWSLPDDAQLAVARVTANNTLFISAVVASVVGFAAWIVVGVLICRVTNAGRFAAGLLMVFVVAGTATNIAAISQLFPAAGATTSGLDAATLAELSASYRRIVLLAQVFSGLWLFPFGWLVVRSRIAPRFLGLCLMVGGICYLMVFATAFQPSLNDLLAYQIASAGLGVPAMIGEFGVCFWFLVKGAGVAGNDRGRMQENAQNIGV